MADLNVLKMERDAAQHHGSMLAERIRELEAEAKKAAAVVEAARRAVAVPGYADCFGCAPLSVEECDSLGGEERTCRGYALRAALAAHDGKGAAPRG